MWILGIGINEYANWPNFFLRNPVNDTKKIIECLERQEGRQFRNVHSLTIFDTEATRQNIINSFQYLKQAKSTDIVFLYINAHGETIDNGTYCFFPHDIGFINKKMKVESNEKIDSSVINRNIFNIMNIPVDIIISNEYIEKTIDYSDAITINEIIQALDINATKILFLETCESGGAINSDNINDIIIFTACGQNESAVEDNQFGNGSIFTEGFVRKINSHNYKEGPLTMEMLFEYTYNFVIELNKSLYDGYYRDKQHPELHLPDKYSNFTFLGNY